MKRMILTCLIFVASLAACEDSEPEPQIVETPDNELVGTKWVAGDKTADAVIGGVNTQVFEFINNDECQYYQTHNGQVRNQASGSYTFEKPTLLIQIDGGAKEFEITGSLMVSTHQKVPFSEEYLTYVKQ